ncbi:MAG: hypothetical protein N2315_08560 [Thermanaerothrix sp.]|nr:hypothetical protein [Thermanaerothrix sp.]
MRPRILGGRPCAAPGPTGAAPSAESPAARLIKLLLLLGALMAFPAGDCLAKAPERLPDASLVPLSSQGPTRLSEAFSGDLALIVLFSPGCPSCEAQIKGAEQLLEQLGPNPPFAVVPIATAYYPLGFTKAVWESWDVKSKAFAEAGGEEGLFKHLKVRNVPVLIWVTKDLTVKGLRRSPTSQGEIRRDLKKLKGL